MSLLITMSVAGSIPFIAYYLVKGLKKGSGRQYRLFLRTSIFFFLCPVQVLKYQLPEEIFTRFHQIEGKIYLKLDGYAMIRSIDGRYVLKPVWLIGLSVIWFGTVCCVVIYQLLKYKKLKKCLLKIYDKQMETAADEQKKILYVKNSSIRTPFTLGILKHWIFLPETELTEDETEMILLHETAHIKNKDLLFKVICLGVCLLHWFNPLAWLLLYEYGNITERICDEQVIYTFTTMEQRKKYATLLVKMAVGDSKIPFAFADHFSNEQKGKSKMKKRIEYIFHPDKKKAGFLTAVWLLTSFFCVSTTFAYSLPASWNKELYELAEEKEVLVDGAIDFSEADMIFLSNEDLNMQQDILMENSIIPIEYDFSQSDIIFIDDTTKVQIAVFLSETEKASCTHSMAEGQIATHTKNNNGGCVVKTYSAEKCTKCSYYQLGEVLSKINYTTCPH